MSFSLIQILLIIIAYLSGLFAVAYLADRGVIPRSITGHPAVYVLSLGVFAGAMASNGVIAMAHLHGYHFLLYYLGVVLMFVLAALLLLPLLRLCRVYQLASLADVLTFRFRSGWVGAAITAAMCVTLLPLLALQIQAVADSIQILGGSGVMPTADGRHKRLALLFCVIITVFSILFGTRHVSSQQRNTGLVTAIAFESLVKLLALLTLMFAAVSGIFGGFAGLEQWLLEHPEFSRSVQQPIGGSHAYALLLVFFAGAVCMPHMFHMTFAENNNNHDLAVATWSLPLYLLLLSLPVMPLTWAGIEIGHDLPMDYSGLAIGAALQSVTVSTAAFFAGLSAASATIIITTLALANMCLNHLILPFRLLHPESGQSIYAQLRWARRGLVAVLILAGYMFFNALSGKYQLTQLALVAFAGTLQFLPGVIATPYWAGANRTGLLAGLAGGLSVWLLSMLLPLIGAYEPQQLNALLRGIPGAADNDPWVNATLAALAVNVALFAALSLLTRTSKSEQVAAEICSMDARSRPVRRSLSVLNAADFATQLATALGEETARSEVELALAELQFSPEENRPYALRRLRARIEANLSGLLGPTTAHRIIENCLPFQSREHHDSDDLQQIEHDIDQAGTRFTGLAADIDNLRRHHRETLDRLPIGVCSIGADDEVLMWNRSMERITGVAANRVIGSLLSTLPEPWCSILVEFQRGNADLTPKATVPGDEPARWISLHRTRIGENAEDMVILVEDITDFELLEAELLHNERLASIGRLAAGVAHEIGNPVTGIACLAQNLEYESDPAEIRHMAEDILKQTQRVARIVESLMNFSHTGSGGAACLRPTNLADCVDEAIHLLSLDREARPVHFRNRCDREDLVVADSQRLLQVFVNVLGNARDACDVDGEIVVRAEGDADEVRIHVEDNGCGIAPEIQAQVFEPFFTTKDPGAGTGLGLALVYSIMDDMAGRVQLTSPIYSAGGPGTRVSLALPRGRYDLGERL